MAYAVVGYFDKRSDTTIKSLWQGVADAGVCDYLIHSKNDPHIKFAMYGDLDAEAARFHFERIARHITKIDVHFKSYSFYPNEKPFLCIDIAASAPLLSLQSEIVKSCESIGTQDGRGFFEPGIWKPDCQLTIAFDKLKLADAVGYLSDTHLPFNGTIERIGLIEFPPARQLYSYTLNEQRGNSAREEVFHDPY